MPAEPQGLDEFLASNDPTPAPTSAPEVNSNDEPAGLDDFIKTEKFSTPGQELATAAEGAANSATFGLSSAAEKALGVPEEDIRARREVNPGIHAAGQIAGLVAGSALLPELSAGRAMSKIAEGVSTATKIANPIALAAVKGAVETALFQGGDEVSKMITEDPNQSASSALAHVGLAALLGGGTSAAFGAINPLWKAASESKAGQFLTDFKNRALEYVQNPAGEATASAAAASAVPEAASAAVPESGNVSEVRSVFNGRAPEGTAEEIASREQAASARITDRLRGKIDIFHPGPAVPESAIPEAPVETPSLTATATEEPTKLTPGAKLADALIKRGVLKKLSSQGLGATVGAGIGKLTGIGGGLGALIGEHALSPFFDSVLPALVKPFLSTAGTAAEAKSAIDYALSVVKGEGLISKAAAAVFDSGREVLSPSFAVSDNDRERLDERLKELHDAPDELLTAGGDIGHFLPDHGSALALTAASAVNYLNSQRPKSVQASPLDEPSEPSEMEKDAFTRTLDIAEQPLTVLSHVKEGTLTPKDLVDFQKLYPALYGQFSTKLTSEMVNALAKGKEVPYHTRMGLSLFLGQPLDSTLTPEGIQQSQMAFVTNAQRPQPGQASKPKRSTTPLSKLSELSQTFGQARERRLVKN